MLFAPTTLNKLIVFMITIVENYNFNPAENSLFVQGVHNIR